MTTTVVVLFQVDAQPDQAEQIVEDRLDSVRLLWQNDSTDAERGTLDPIRTYGVVPAQELFMDWL